MDNNSVRRTLLLAVTAVASVAFASDEGVDTPEHVTGEQPYPFDSADPREEDTPAIELPDSVAQKLELLTAEEVEFLQSGDARRFTGPLEEVVKALEERTPAEVRAWVDAMQNHPTSMPGECSAHARWTRSENPVRSRSVATMATAAHRRLAATRWRCRRRTWWPARSMSLSLVHH